MAQTYSHSRLATFEDCPKRFEYRYVLKIEADSEGIEAFVGKRVHEVLERLYLAVGRRRMPTLPRVIARYHKMFDEAYDPGRVRIVRQGTPLAFYRNLGERCLSAYYRRHYPFDRGETLGVERRVTFSLDPEGRYRIQGIIDRIARAPDGTIEIHDYKTGRRVPEPDELERDRQLALYQIGLSAQFPDAPMRLVWHYLQHNRVCTSSRTADQLDAVRTDAIGVIDRIRSAIEFKPRRSKLCDWCEYNDRCPAYPRAARDDAALPGAPTPPPQPAPRGQLQLFS